jgi:hypothetical protein
MAMLALGICLLLPSTSRAALQLQEMGAALALPLLTDDVSGGQTVTYTTITNGSSENLTLAINVLNGDPGESWRSASFSCHVTGRETTLFRFEPDGSGRSKVSFECSTTDANSTSPPDQLNVLRTEHLLSATGIMFVAIEQNGRTVSKNALFGEATVIDYAQGMAYSLPAISFQGNDPFAQDGDTQYRFDNKEYSGFPAVLASNFLAPKAGNVTADLVLFTLDGKTGQGPIPVDLKVDFFNDDELHRDASIRFDCFAVLRLEDIDPRFLAPYLQSPAGSFTLTPRDVSVGFSPHERTGSGVDGVRNSPVHGWLVQTVMDGGMVEGATLASQGLGGWGRPLAQSVTSHVPTPGDVVNLDTR